MDLFKKAKAVIEEQKNKTKAVIEEHNAKKNIEAHLKGSVIQPSMTSSIVSKAKESLSSLGSDKRKLGDTALQYGSLVFNVNKDETNTSIKEPSQSKGKCTIYLTCDGGQKLLEEIKDKASKARSDFSSKEYEIKEKYVQSLKDIYDEAKKALGNNVNEDNADTTCAKLKKANTTKILEISDALKTKKKNMEEKVNLENPIGCAVGDSTASKGEIVHINLVAKTIGVKVGNNIKTVNVSDICIGSNSNARHSYDCEQTGGTKKKSHSSKIGGSVLSMISDDSNGICE